MNINDMNMMSSPRILGIGANRFFQTRKDRATVYDSEIKLFLPYRSRVTLSVNGNTYHSALYDIGNQFIDTSQLPSGSYFVDIEIKDGIGTRNEKYFFIKSVRIPPMNKIMYYLNIGAIQEPIISQSQKIPESSKNPIYRTGIGFRITKNFAFIGNIISSNQEGGAEEVLLFENKHFFFRSSYLHTTQDDYGGEVHLEIRNAKKTFLTSFNSRKVIEGKHAYRLSNELDIVTRNLEQHSGNISYVIGRTNLGFNGRKAGMSYTYGPTITKTIFTTGRFALSMNAAASKTDIDKNFFVNFRLFYNDNHVTAMLDGYNSGSESLINKNTNRVDNHRYSQYVSWQDGDLLKERVILEARNEVNKYSGNDRREVGVDLSNKLGRARFDGVNTDHNNSYVATTQFSLASNNQHLAFGGRNLKQSAVIIDVDGDNDSDGKFDVIVNNSYEETVSIGSKALVTLAPFNRYKVKIQPSGNRLVNGDDKVHIIDSFYGNVENIKYQAKQSVIIIAKLVDGNGGVIANAKISSSIEDSTSDQNGYFQIYSYKNDDIEVVMMDGRKCKAKLPKSSKFDKTGIIRIDNMLCVN